MNQNKLIQVSKLLADAKKLANTDSIVVDYATLKSKIVHLEFMEGLSLLQNLLVSDDFEDEFKAICALREKDQERTIAFSAAANSQINKLYWDIAALVFEPETMSEMLQIIAPSVKEQITLTYPDTLPRPMNSRELIEYKNNLTPTVTINKNLNELNQAPEFKNLSNYVFLDNKIFDTSDMAHLPLRMHIRLSDLLQEKYPELAAKIRTHNSDFQQLTTDIKAVKNNGITPLEVLSRLYAAYALGGSEVTGHGYASEEAIEATKKFLAYFYALPQTLQNDITKLDGGMFGNILKTQILKGTCVHGTTSQLNGFLLRNKDNPVLTTPPNMPQAECDKLYAHYNKIYLKTEKDSTHLEVLPTELTIQAINLLNPNREALISLFTHFPAQSYDALFEGLLLLNYQSGRNGSELLPQLALVIQPGIFNKEKLAAFIKSLSKYFDRLTTEDNSSFLAWILNRQTQLPISDILKEMDVERRLFAIISLQSHHIQNLRLIIANEPAQFTSLLDLFPDDQKIIVINSLESNGVKLAHDIARSPVALNSLLSLYSREEVRDLMWWSNAKGEIVLHHAVSSIESVRLILSYFPEGIWTHLIQHVDMSGVRVLDKAIDNREVLEFFISSVPASQRLDMITTPQTNGRSLLLRVAEKGSAEALEFLLSHWTAEQLVDMVQAVDESGNSILSLAAKNVEMLKVIVSHLPADRVFEIIKNFKKNGDGLLHLAAIATRPEALKFLLSLWPKEQLLEALKSTNGSGLSVLESNQENSEFLLELVPESQRFEEVTEEHADKLSLLHRAAFSHYIESSVTILRSLPEDQRWNALMKQSAIEGRSVLQVLFKNHLELDLIYDLLPGEKKVWFQKLQALSKNHKLFMNLDVMYKYIQEIYYELPEKSQIPMRNLANELEFMAIDFFVKSFEKPMTDEEIYAFQEDFKDLLHSKDDIMQEHRAVWIPILNNILLGLITGGIGFIAIAINASINAVKAHNEGRKFTLNDALFFAHTQREKNGFKVEQAVDDLDIPGNMDEITSISVG